MTERDRATGPRWSQFSANSDSPGNKQGDRERPGRGVRRTWFSGGRL